MIGCSFVPLPLYAAPPTAALRLAKPAFLVAAAHVASIFLGDAVGVAAVAAVAAAGAACHRRHCAAAGAPRWLATPSPYLFRNAGQTRAWASIA